MGVHEHLMDGERIVLQHPPFYLTSHRLLRCENDEGSESFREIPLLGMTEVEQLRVTDHKIMSIGAGLVVSGVILMATWGLFTAFLGVIAGIVALVLGSKGKVTGHQVKSPRIPDRESEMWLLPTWGADNFVNKLKDITTENQDPNPPRY
jgi:hypothetical protein